MKMRLPIFVRGLAGFALAGIAHAAVSEADASRLGKELTPLGAEYMVLLPDYGATGSNLRDLLGMSTGGTTSSCSPPRAAFSADKTALVKATEQILNSGGTPLFDQMHRDGRVLKAMPLALYFTQYYAVTTLEHYDPIEYYDHLIDLYATIGSMRMLAKRLMTPVHPYLRLLNAIRTLADRGAVREFTAVRHQLATDRQLLAFHTGRSETLPEFYHQRFEQRVGPYAELLPRGERTPVLDRTPSSHQSMP